jgi:transposase
MVKWSVGIDIAKSKFDVCIKTLQDKKVTIKGTHRFENSDKGFLSLEKWILIRTKAVENVIIVMEATGVYYEDLAYYFYEKGFQVNVVLANKIKHYFKSLNLKSKTDKIDADAISSFGLERNEPIWKPMSKVYKELRETNRLLQSYKHCLNSLKSQLHAMKHAHNYCVQVKKIHINQIADIEKTIDKLENEIRKIVAKDPELKERIKRIETIKGVGFCTVVTVLCETNGFETFNNLRQVTSYAGLDVKLNESGSKKGKTSISKRGNVHIRQALYMNALSAVQYNKPIKELHHRICEKNTDTRQKGVVAAMRKLLVLIFILWKKNETFNENYVWNKANIR